VFGAPLDQPDHRDRAIAAARDMLARLDAFNARSPDRAFAMGIGINTGYAMCGNVGSQRRLEYAAIGDTTNTASRLQGMTKGSGYAVFVSDATRSALQTPAADLELVGERAVRGRSGGVLVWGMRVPARTLRVNSVPVTVTQAIPGRGDEMYQDRLKDVPFFAALSKKDLEVVSQQADELDVPEGKVLIRQGELGQEFFVVESGKASITIDGAHVRDAGPGDFFGEMALLDEERRTATVTATSPMTVIVMTRASFRALDQTVPSVHAAVRDAIAQRRLTTP